MDWYWLNVNIVELDWMIRHSLGEYLQKIPRIRFECSNSLLILLEFANTRAIWKTANGRKCLRTFANSWKCSNNRKFQRIQCEFKIFGDRKKERMFVFQMSKFLAQNLSNARKYLEYFVNFRILRKRMNFLRPNCNTTNVFFFCLALRCQSTFAEWLKHFHEWFYIPKIFSWLNSKCWQWPFQQWKWSALLLQ